MDESRVPRWSTRERRRAHQCSAFDVYVEEVALPDGSTARFDYVSEPPSAVVLGFTAAEGSVIVLREYRHAVGRVALGLPGGSAEPADADLATTARRELREEAGYRAESVTPLLSAEPANGLLDSVRHYFVAEGCVPAGEPDLDSDETIEVTTMPLETLRERVLTGGVHDERTVTAVAVHAAGVNDRPD